MTKWTRLTPGTEDADSIILAHWNTPKWLTLRAGLQDHGELRVDVRGGSIGLSAAELANIPQPPEEVAE